MWEFKKIFTLEILYTAGTICLALTRKFYWPKAPVAIGLLLTIGLLGQIFRLYKEQKIHGRNIVCAVAVFMACLIISSILAYSIDAGHSEHWDRYVVSYSAAIIIFLAFMLSEKTIQLFNAIAAISYPVYLLHEIIFRVAFGKIFYRGINAPLFITGTLASLIIASVLAHILIEKPMMSFGSKLEKRLE